ncbi:Uncharacterized protein CFRS1_v014254 [Colletotrichum fructicola]|nr:Uncharacterized protein CFRS1_v014254 [Colletotrichum fructicola]
MGSQADLSKGCRPQRPVLFFDIDNCLYSRDAKIFDLVSDLIDEYFEKHLSLTREEAVKLHHQYHTDYGHSIEGLVRHHKIDPIEYNAQVDDALPLEDILKPDVQLRKLLEDVDTSKVRLWLLTNAYVTHAKRVIRILGVEDLFEGLTYCDYSQVPFICKPNKNMFLKAMKEAGVESVQDCYFVDDSYGNCVGAQKAGWTAAHFLERGLPMPSKEASQYQIQSLEELRDIFPQFFKSRTWSKTS